ncbi:hypothetical protein RQN30_07150 [Arcanobacterium hippocoleae]
MSQNQHKHEPANPPADTAMPPISEMPPRKAAENPAEVSAEDTLPAAVAEVDFVITGMTCASCAARVEKNSTSFRV